ncbi:hypothetical protein D3C75_687120 [compost metagenome]
MQLEGYTSGVHIRVGDNPVGQVILRSQAQHIRLNPDQGILADQNNRLGLLLLLFFHMVIQRNRQNPVVIGHIPEDILHFGEAAVI